MRGFFVSGLITAIIGAILIFAGFGANISYKENTITVNAKITRIESETDHGGEFTSYDHLYYGEYTVNDTKYTDIVILEDSSANSPNPKYSVGDILTIKVNKDNPETLAGNGTMLFIVGGVLIACSAFFFYLYRNIKNTRKRKELLAKHNNL